MTADFGAGHRTEGLLSYLVQAKKRRRTGELDFVEVLEVRTLLAGASPVIALNQSFGVLSSSPAGADVGTVEATDAEADPITYSIAAGNDVGAFEIDAATGKITVKNQSLLNSLPSETILSIKVSETGTPGNSDTKDVTIRLNRVPIINDTEFAVLSTIAAGDTIGTVSGSDPDAGQALTYFITAGNETGAFAIQATTGTITVLNKVAFDNLAFPRTLTIQVRDSGAPQGTDTATVTIHRNTQPSVVAQEFELLSVAAVGTEVGIVQASTEDAGQTLTFEIVSGNNGAFEINNNGRLTVANTSLLAVYGAQAQLTVRVTDNGVNPLSNTAVITVKLNRPPILNDVDFAVASTIAQGAIIGTVTATDPDVGQILTYFITVGNETGAFSIDALTGAIQVGNKSAFNLLPPSHQLTIEVRDSGDPQGVDTGKVTISRNSPPIVENKVFSILANVPAGFEVGTVPVVNEVGQSLKFEFDPANGAFQISNTGVITVANTSLLGVLSSTNVLTVKVTDNGNPSLSATGQVTININRLPVYYDATFIVESDFAVNESVGIAAAMDPDSNSIPAGQLTYAIVGGNASGAFSIDSTTGEIKVANKAAFNALSFPVELTVEARDKGTPQGIATAKVTVVLSGPPVVNGQILFLLTEEARTYHMGQPPVRLDPQSIFRLGAGVEDTFVGGSLTVTAKTTVKGTKPGRLSVVSEERGSITVSGESILYGKVVIGTFDRAQARQGILNIKFNASTTAASIEAMLKRIGLQAKGQATVRTVEFEFKDIPSLPAEQRRDFKTVNIAKRIKSKT